MVTGVVVALPAEWKILTRNRSLPGQVVSLHPKLLAVRSRIGAEAATIAAGNLIEEGADHLVSWGSAAGLDPALKPGMLLLPARVLGPDADSVSCSSYLLGQIQKKVSSDFSFLSDVHHGAAPLLRTIAEKQELCRISGAASADMESWAIAKVAKDNALPFIVVRSVSDDAESRIPIGLVRALNDRGELESLKLILEILRSPIIIPELVRLGKNFQKVKKTLRQTIPMMTSFSESDGD